MKNGAQDKIRIIFLGIALSFVLGLCHAFIMSSLLPVESEVSYVGGYAIVFPVVVLILSAIVAAMNFGISFFVKTRTRKIFFVRTIICYLAYFVFSFWRLLDLYQGLGMFDGIWLFDLEKIAKLLFIVILSSITSLPLIMSLSYVFNLGAGGQKAGYAKNASGETDMELA